MNCAQGIANFPPFSLILQLGINCNLW